MTVALLLPVAPGRQKAGASEYGVLTDAGSIARARTELLETFFEQMNATGVSYCVLNGFEGYPEEIASDVDFMVRPKDSRQIASLVLEVARQCGAMLVQAMRHETGAWYFVLAKPTGGAVAYLHPDCTTDYRRDGRLWMEAEPVLDKRKRYNSFFVPCIADEFLYYLIKKILKQRITDAQWRRMVALYLSCPEECDERFRRFWAEGTAEALAVAFRRDELEWVQFHLTGLLSQLRASAPVEARWKRVQQRAGDWRRRLERVMNPTGLSVAVSGGTKRQRAEMAKALEEHLRPAFRRTLICGEEATGDGLWGAVPIWRAKARSTLVIRKKEAARKEWLVRDEIGFVLSDGVPVNERSLGVPGSERVSLDGQRTVAQNIERATRVTLEYLAARLQRRMKPDGSSPIAIRIDA
jgi:hypothetical protein